MLIDASDTNTIPVDIEQKIIGYFSRLPKNIVVNMKRYKVKNDNDIMCAIEKYVSSIFDFRQMLIPLFEQHELVCYHSTKILDKDIILSDGLKTNDWNIYSKNIANTLRNLGEKEDGIDKAIEAIKHKYDWKYTSYGREPQLCFYSDIGLLRNDGYAGYEQFCENIGGELARQALKDAYPQMYRSLRDNGDAVLVKFKIPFVDIKKYVQSGIIYKFVIYFAGKYFWNCTYQIHYDGHINKDVDPTNIIEIIMYPTNR